MSDVAMLEGKVIAGWRYKKGGLDLLKVRDGER